MMRHGRSGFFSLFGREKLWGIDVEMGLVGLDRMDVYSYIRFYIHIFQVWARLYGAHYVQKYRLAFRSDCRRTCFLILEEWLCLRTMVAACDVAAGGVCQAVLSWRGNFLPREAQ